MTDRPTLTRWTRGQRVGTIYDEGKYGKITEYGPEVCEVLFDGERVPRYIINKYLKLEQRPKLRQR